jgi:MFS family permease
MRENRTRPVTVLALCATEFAALSAMVVPGLIALQLLAGQLDSNLEPESRLSWITTSGGIAAIIAGPLFGWLSDRTAHRAGHRGAWLAAGSVLGLLFLVLAANATTLSEMVTFWVCFQASYAALFAALFASIADFVPEGDRSRVVGLFAGAGMASVAFAGLLVWLLLNGHLGVALSNPKAVFAAMAVVAVPVSLLASWHFRTLGGAAGPVVPRKHDRGFLRPLVEPGAPFWWLLVQRLLVQATYSCMTIYAVLYLVRRNGEAPHHAAEVVGIATAIGGTIATVVAMWGARRFARLVGYRAALSTGVAILLVGTVTMAFSTVTPVFFVAHLCAGTGLGLYLALDMVVALDQLPPATAGRLLGYFATARKVSQSVIPAIGPTLLAIGGPDVAGVDRSQNYSALLLFGTLMAIAALGISSRLKVPDRP